jgi:hypothetical protein
MKRRRKQQRLVQLVGTEALTHEYILKADEEKADTFQRRLYLSPTGS